MALILANSLPYLENLQYVAGQLLLNLGRKREALRYLKRAVELAPNETKNLLALSQAYWAESKKQEAKHILTQLLQIDPNHASAQRLLQQLQ